MMEEGNGKNEEVVKNNREEIFSEAVRAGKRTYFFDVKATRRNDYYLTITESKKRFNRDGKSFYEKHKVFLYKEDFDKFVDGLVSAIDYIKKNNPMTQGDNQENGRPNKPEEAAMAANYTDIEFEDLDENKS
jgi:hypothetical protein